MRVQQQVLVQVLHPVGREEQTLFLVVLIQLTVRISQQ
jgi:hypothetical protein